MSTLASHLSRGARRRTLVALAASLVVVATFASSCADEKTPEKAPAPAKHRAPGVRLLTFHYAASNGRPRAAYLLLPAWYGPSDNPPLPLVISPHGRGATGLSNIEFFGDLPGVGGFAVVSPDGMGRRLGRFSYGYAARSTTSRRCPAPPFERSRGCESTARASSRSAAAWAARRRRCSSRGIRACSPAPRRWTRSRTSPAATARWPTCRAARPAAPASPSCPASSSSRSCGARSASRRSGAARLRRAQRAQPGPRDRPLRRPVPDLVERRRPDRHRPGASVRRALPRDPPHRPVRARGRLRGSLAALDRDARIGAAADRPRRLRPASHREEAADVGALRGSALPAEGGARPTLRFPVGTRAAARA